MSYPPQPYPPPSGNPQYGYPPGYMPGYSRPSTIGPSARWAGIVAVVLALLSLLMGGIVIGLAHQMVQMAYEQNEPNMMRGFEQLAEVGSKPEVFFYVFGGMFIAYGVIVGIVAAILLASRSKAGPTIGLIAFIPFTLLVLLNLFSALLQANAGGVVLVLVVLAPHVLVIFWLIKSLRTGPQMPMMYPGYPPGYPSMQVPPPPQPMQGYYQPPKQ